MENIKNNLVNNNKSFLIDFIANSISFETFSLT